MAGRGSALSRAIRFFEEGDIREVEVCFQIVKDILVKRIKAKVQVNKPAVKRNRRTKEQIQADKERESRREAIEQGQGAGA